MVVVIILPGLSSSFFIQLPFRRRRFARRNDADNRAETLFPDRMHNQQNPIYIAECVQTLFAFRRAVLMDGYVRVAEDFSSLVKTDAVLHDIRGDPCSRPTRSSPPSNFYSSIYSVATSP